MLVLDLPWPPTLNHYWRHVGKCTLISKAGRSYRMDVACHIARLGVVSRYGTLVGRLAVTLTAFPPDKRARDLDNLQKAALDALTHAHVWDDDSQIDDLRIVRGPVVEFGMLRIDIKPLLAQGVA